MTKSPRQISARTTQAKRHELPRSIKRRSLERAATRILDVSVSILGLLAMAPVLVLLAAAIWVHDGGAPLFVHWRIGRGGRKFPCLKFRTMVINAEEYLHDMLAADPIAEEEWRRDNKLRADPRVTKLGQFLRKSSLDEVPQLANIIMGHMSLVGPRPIVESEIARYGRYFHHYCSVKPGLTGLWQVSGRNDVSYRRRVALDTAYARRKSLPTDLMILQRTLPAVLSGRGVS